MIMKNISEKILQKLILENISSFLRELGAGFSYIDNEYKIKATKALNELFDQEYTNQNKKDNQMY